MRDDSVDKRRYYYYAMMLPANMRLDTPPRAMSAQARAQTLRHTRVSYAFGVHS